MNLRVPAIPIILPLLLGLAGSFSVRGAVAVSTNTLARASGAASVPSVFVDDPKFGKDPFFPSSGRRAPKVQNPVVTKTPETSIANLALRGISTLKERRLALINNYTLQAGEETDLKVDGQTVRVRCVSVKERSVIIGINGVTRELFLRPGL